MPVKRVLTDEGFPSIGGTCYRIFKEWVGASPGGAFPHTLLLFSHRTPKDSKIREA